MSIKNNQIQNNKKKDEKRKKRTKRNRKTPCNYVMPPDSRLNGLATPRHPRKKYDPTIGFKSSNKIEIVNKEEQISNRLVQLAVPYFRNLLAARQDYKPILSETMYMNLNNHLQTSAHTMYSRFYNTEMPEKKDKKKWTPEDWAKHNAWLEIRAKPKEEIQENIEEPSKQDVDMERIKMLATPRLPTPKFTLDTIEPINVIPRSALTFEPPESLIKLSEPKARSKRTKYNPLAAEEEESPPPAEDFEPYVNPFFIPRDYQKIKSVGLAKLSTTKASRATKKFVKADNINPVFCISPNALKYKVTAKTTQLSEPKEDLSKGLNPNAFKVSEAAKTLKLKKKKLEYYMKLAKPRNFTPK